MTARISKWNAAILGALLLLAYIIPLNAFVPPIPKQTLPMEYLEAWGCRVMANTLLWGWSFIGQGMATVLEDAGINPHSLGYDHILEYRLWVVRVATWYPQYEWMGLSPPPTGVFVVFVMDPSLSKGDAYAEALDFSNKILAPFLGVKEFYNYTTGFFNLALLPWNLAYLGYNITVARGTEIYLYAPPPPPPKGIGTIYDAFFQQLITRINEREQGGFVTLVRESDFKNASFSYSVIYFRRDCPNYTTIALTRMEPPGQKIYWDASTQEYHISLYDILNISEADYPEIPQSPMATASIIFANFPGGNLTRIEGVELSEGTPSETPYTWVGYPEYQLAVAAFSVAPGAGAATRTAVFKDVRFYFSYNFKSQLLVEKTVDHTNVNPGDSVQVTVKITNIGSASAYNCLFNDTETYDPNVFTTSDSLYFIIDEIKPGETVTRSYTLTVKSDVGTGIVTYLKATTVHWTDRDGYEDVRKTGTMGFGKYTMHVQNTGFMAASNTVAIGVGKDIPKLTLLCKPKLSGNWAFVPGEGVGLNVTIVSDRDLGAVKFHVADYYDQASGNDYTWQVSSGKTVKEITAKRNCADTDFQSGVHFFFRPFVNATVTVDGAELHFNSSWCDVHAVFSDHPEEDTKNVFPILYPSDKPYITREIKRAGEGGRLVNVTITITNVANVGSEAVIREFLPEGLDFNTSSVAFWQISVGDPKGVILNGSVYIPPSKSITVWYTANLTQSKAYLFHPTAVWFPSINRTYYGLFQEAHLELDIFAWKVCESTSVMAGGMVEVRIYVQNWASERISVNVTDPLPTNFIPEQGTFEGNRYSAYLPVNPGETKLFNYTMSAGNATGSYPIPAGLVKWEAGGQPFNLTLVVYASITITPQPVVEQTVKGEVEVVVPTNSQFYVTVKVNNIASVTVDDVRVEVVIPTELELVDEGNFTRSGDELVSDLGSMDPGASVMLSYKLKVGGEEKDYEIPPATIIFTYQGVRYQQTSNKIVVKARVGGAEAEGGAGGVLGAAPGGIPWYIIVVVAIVAAAAGAGGFIYYRRVRKLKKIKAEAAAKGATVTCPKCGAELPAGATFCPHCGEKIS